MRRFATLRLFVILAVALVAGGPVGAQVTAPAPVKRHQATGALATSGATQLVLLKTFGRNQARWNFVLNPKTKLEGKLTKGARIRIYYYNDVKGQRVAERIKVLGPASPPVAKAPATPAAPSPPQPSH